MEQILIGFDFSMNKPAATIYYKGQYYHYFWPLNLNKKLIEKYNEAGVFVHNRDLPSINVKTIENSQIVLIHTIRSTDLANMIIEDIDNFIKNQGLEDYDLYVCSEGLSYASKGDATLNLATYKGVLLSKIYEHYGDYLRRLFTYPPISLKATAECAGKDDIKDKSKMIKKYILENNQIKMRLCLANNMLIAKKNYITGVDDIVDSYWALKTMVKKENISLN